MRSSGTPSAATGGGYAVKIAPGSVSFAPETFAVYDHDLSNPVGTTFNNSLRLSADDRGVKVQIDLPDTTTGRDLGVLIARRDIRGMSFQMTTDPSGPIDVIDGLKVMTLDPFMIKEVTITNRPAFLETTIDIAAAEAAFTQRREHRTQLARLQFSQFRRLAGVSAV